MLGYRERVRLSFSWIGHVLCSESRLGCHPEYSSDLAALACAISDTQRPAHPTNAPKGPTPKKEGNHERACHPLLGRLLPLCVVLHRLAV